MKKFYTLSLVLFVSTLFAQIPAGYYNTATGTGYSLKTQLYNIIKGHTDQGYAGLYVTYRQSDADKYYEKNNTLLDIYSENPGGADAYEYTYGGGAQDDGSGGTAEGQKYNREHIVPQSYFDSELPMYADAHFIVPTDKYVNGKRDNLPFGKVNTSNQTFTNGSKLGANLNSGYSAGYSSTVFEPIDEFKGDVARMILYFVTRYETQLAGFYSGASAGLQSKVMFDGSENKALSDTFLKILVTWHNQDPVSQREIDRNNAIYLRQRNRNPYIDHPEYIQTIWGAALATEQFETLSQIAVFPNPSNDNRINIQSEQVLEEIVLININGQIIQQIKKPAATGSTYTLNNIPQGFYLLKLNANNQSTTKKVIIN
jgi:endonuclease I